MNKWIETSNDGLINANYIVTVMPRNHENDKDKKYVYEIEIELVNKDYPDRLTNFKSKEQRDEWLFKLKNFLKTVETGTLNFPKEN